MDDEAFEAWSDATRSAGIDAFAVNITDFPLRLLPAPIGSIGRADTDMVSALGAYAWWLNDDAVQARLHAILFYQRVVQQPARFRARNGGIIEIHNPLFGATLLADTEQAGEAVTRILADAARRQEGYLSLVAQIPEGCEHRIYVLSSALSLKIYWLPRNRRQRLRRAQ